MARSWIASPVESNKVMSPALRRPSASPTSTVPSSVTEFTRDGTRRHGCGQLAAVARLLPVVAEDVRAAELCDRDLGLPWAVGAHQRDVLACFERAFGIQDVGPRRHRDDDLARECFCGARRDTRAKTLGDELATARVDVPDERRHTVCDEHPGRLGAVDAAPDHGVRGSLGATERVSGEHAGRRSSERRHRGSVEDSEQAAVLGVREQHEPGHRRQAARRVPRERGDPLQQRMPVSDRRHGAEVACRIVRHVDLRWHRPRRARMRLERATNGVVRLVRRDSSLDVGGPEDGDHADFTAEISLSTDSFASPNSIVVFGSR